MKYRDKKHVSFVIYNLSSGGAERVVTELANYLSNYYKISIITLVKCEPFYSLNKKVNLLSLEIPEKAKPNFIGSGIGYYKIINRLRNLIVNHRIDIIIGFTTSVNIFSVIAGKFSGIPIIISERSNPTLENLNKFWIFFRRIIYPFADKLIVQSPGTYKFYEKIMTKKKILIIPNPISQNLGIKKKNINKAIQRENIILNIGRLTHQKAQHLLIEAFAHVHEDNWKLVIVGEGERKQELITIAKKHGIEDKVQLVGKHKDTSEFYNSASIFVLSSLFEGFPNVLVEALFFGLPCISSNCDYGPSLLIRHNKNGFLFEVGNVNELSECLKLLMGNEELRIQFGTIAKESVNHLNIKVVGKIWIKEIEVLINH